MARLELFWTITALKQRDHIFECWNNRNKSNNYTKHLLALINQRTTTLLSFPEIGKNVDFKNTRVISIEHYSLFYVIDTNRIIITAFWDDRRNPKDLLSLLENK